MFNINSPKSNILIIGPKPPPYHGVSIATGYLLDKIDSNNFNIFHVDLSDRRGIQHVNKPDLWDVFLFINQFFKAIRIIFKYHPSLVYIPISQRGVGFFRDSLFVVLSIFFRCKIVMHLHGGNFRKWYNDQGFLFRSFIKTILKNTDAMIVLSSVFKSLFNGLVPFRNIFVVPNGIDYSCDKHNANLIETKPHEPLTVTYLGTLNRLKGVHILLKSIPDVINLYPNIRFIFAGPWSSRQDQLKAEAFISRNNLSPFITFTGTVTDKAKWNVLHCSDIFVFPGIQQEGQPLVILEALAAGIPILYTDRGCIKQIIHEGINGLQIKTNDPKDLAEKILFLANNPILINKIKIRNIKLFQKEYTSKIFADSISRVFLKVLKNS